MLCMMDGRRTIQEIWENLSTRIDDVEEQPTQDETIQLLTQLHHADLLHGDLLPDMRELSERSRKRSRREVLMRVMNPLALRIPLFDPDRFLELTTPMVRLIFSRVGFAVWLVVVGFGILLAVRHLEALANDAVAMAFTGQNLLLMAVTYIVIKSIHEFGHGYATKVWGGEVHEIGIMILVLMPVPYIDASSASAFSQKWRRALVASAGIMTEALLAALAIVFWVLAEPGLARTIAFNVILIGGVSTILFNGNPLLRFDGYYALCDVLEIPNLGTRANRYFLYLVRREVLGVRGEDSPVTAQGEAGWFFVYSVSAFFYRLFIMVTICLFIATQLFFLGVILALFALFYSIVWPVIKGIRYFATHAGLRGHRARGLGIFSAGIAMISAFALYLPLPYSTMSQGVVQLPESSFVRAQGNGFVRAINVRPGQVVSEGTSLIEMQDVVLHGRLNAQRKVLAEVTARKREAEVSDRVQARLLAEQIRHAEADIASTERQLRELTIHSGKSGRVIVPRVRDLVGRFVTKGEILAYVMNPEDLVVRVVVDQGSVDLVRYQTNRITVRRVEDLRNVVEARIVREVPMAQTMLPSAALGTDGGGEIVFAGDVGTPRTFEGMFNFDLALSDARKAGFVGTRVYVRFDHGKVALGPRFVRELRQVFLTHFRI